MSESFEFVRNAAGRMVPRIAGLAEPQGVGYVPQSDMIYVAGARDGAAGEAGAGEGLGRRLRAACRGFSGRAGGGRAGNHAGRVRPRPPPGQGPRRTSPRRTAAAARRRTAEMTVPSLLGIPPVQPGNPEKDWR